jgi:poly-beta-1,6-N-acetyl-D-glucosamine synthase
MVMMLLKLLFWFSLLIVAYSYIGYGIVLYVLVRLKKAFSHRKQEQRPPAEDPAVSLVVSAFNEEEFIERKIQNSLELDYPADKLQIIFITDGSTDRTPEIVGQYPVIQLLHEPERRGKGAAMNRAIGFVRTPLVIFSDANTLLNKEGVRNITRHYADPRVGGVAGEKKIISAARDKAAGSGEGIYWKYESFLKKLDAGFHSVVGAAGELFSVRTALFEPVERNAVIEDFVLSLQVCMKGYVVQYEPGAYAMETASANMKEEQKRKVRIAAGAFQAMIILKGLFNIFKYPLLSFQFISHRILRWTLCPLCLVILLAANIALAMIGSGDFYLVFLCLQIVFYTFAGIGWALANRNVRVKLLYIPYYFLFMNLAVFIGFWRFIRRKQSVLWEKSARQQPLQVPATK